MAIHFPHGVTELFIMGSYCHFRVLSVLNFCRFYNVDFMLFTVLFICFTELGQCGNQDFCKSGKMTIGQSKQVVVVATTVNKYFFLTLRELSYAAPRLSVWP